MGMSRSAHRQRAGADLPPVILCCNCEDHADCVEDVPARRRNDICGNILKAESGAPLRGFFTNARHLLSPCVSRHGSASISELRLRLPTVYALGGKPRCGGGSENGRQIMCAASTSTTPDHVRKAWKEANVS